MPDVPGAEVGRSEVKTPSRPGTVRIGLPLKIVGIIFRGLLTIGLLMATAAEQYGLIPAIDSRVIERALKFMRLFHGVGCGFTMVDFGESDEIMPSA